jgi:hypothetical protein
MQNESKSVVALGYDAVYDATPRSPTLRRLWQNSRLASTFRKSSCI